MRRGVGLATLLAQEPWRPGDGSRRPDPRPAACRPSADRDPQAGPRSPYALPQRSPAPGSVLPGPGKEETHFRRVHDLPRLLLTLAAGVGAGHRDNWTGQRSPPSLAGFRRADPRGFSLQHSLRPPGTPDTAHALGLRVESQLWKDRENRSSLEIPELCKDDCGAPPSPPLAPPLCCSPGVGGNPRDFVIVSWDWL